ncbi:MAG: Crp/Fnr family transcriptional regulator [bacterium]|nr:Crp/Fnr family transcriptional regulator [bacterium]
MLIEETLDKLWYLKRINLLEGLSADGMKYIKENTRMKNYKKGEVIYFSHSQVNHIFFLKKGKVKLYKTDLSGREMVFAILKHNESFGSLTQFNNNTQNEFAEAMEDSLVCIMNKNFFFSFIKDKPTIILRLNKLLSLKIYELEVLLEELTFKTVLERTVSLFVKLNDKFGIQYNQQNLINISLTHNDIASMIGSTRESTTVALNTLKDQGLIDSLKKKIIIKDLAKLENFSRHNH